MLQLPEAADHMQACRFHVAAGPPSTAAFTIRPSMSLFRHRDGMLAVSCPDLCDHSTILCADGHRIVAFSAPIASIAPHLIDTFLKLAEVFSVFECPVLIKAAREFPLRFFRTKLNTKPMPVVEGVRPIIPIVRHLSSPSGFLFQTVCISQNACGALCSAGVSH